MIKMNKEEIGKFLDNSLEELRRHNTPMENLRIWLIDDFYYLAGKDFWIDYQKEHPNITIEFTGSGRDYKLVNGELVLKEIF